jgi:2'-5' RNA ligase
MPRLFTAIEIPAHVCDELARLRVPMPGAKWIERENFHLTVRFVGDVDNSRANEFADRLAAIDVPAFSLRLTGLGAFGGNSPHAIWAAVERGEQLDTLARAHERAARAAGCPPETRTFKPHVTIARLRHTKPDIVARFLGRQGGYRSEPFFVGRFVLLSSRPQTGGGPYVVEEAYPLQGGGIDQLADQEGGW